MECPKSPAGEFLHIYLSLTKAAAHLCMSKVALSKAAEREGWEVLTVGNNHLFLKDDVRQYRDHRQRTNLVKAFGWKGRGLYRVDDIDISCPVCGGFAVEWPAPPLLPEMYLCLNGHKGDV